MTFGVGGWVIRKAWEGEGGAWLPAHNAHYVIYAAVGGYLG
jgi:hypothetical protein